MLWMRLKSLEMTRPWWLRWFKWLIMHRNFFRFWSSLSGWNNWVFTILLFDSLESLLAFSSLRERFLLFLSFMVVTLPLCHQFSIWNVIISHKLRIRPQTSLPPHIPFLNRISPNIRWSNNNLSVFITISLPRLIPITHMFVRRSNNFITKCSRQLKILFVARFLPSLVRCLSQIRRTPWLVGITRANVRRFAKECVVGSAFFRFFRCEVTRANFDFTVFISHSYKNKKR